MGILIKTTREWWLIALCVLLLMANFFPQTIEYVYPLLDQQGSNLMNMDTDQQIYRCGQTVSAQMIFQKQRNISGMVRWTLVPNNPNGHIEIYPSRVAASAIGIYNTWVNIEPLPNICQPGRYHFEGTITYPLLLGNVSYNLRTTCFKVVDK